MALSPSLLAADLPLLSFQGVTLDRGEIILATIEADLLRICPNGTVKRWVNVSRYGIPTGIANLNGAIAVAISAQESGHFLLTVSPSGEIKTIADLSEAAGEFGAPFAVSLHQGHYPYYLVSICTDVLRSGSTILKVTPSGKVTTLATLSASAFGLVDAGSGVLVTQDDGMIRQITAAGQVIEIVDVAEAGYGVPFGIAHYQGGYAITTNTDWVLQLAIAPLTQSTPASPEYTLSPLCNCQEAGFPLPTALVAIGDRLIVATGKGNLLRIDSTLVA